MKTVNDLTIKEYSEYAALLAEESVDQFAILELFGYDPLEMNVTKMNVALASIASTMLSVNKVKRYYKVNGWVLKANLNLTNISAAQFLDLQTYLKDYKLHEILTVFLIPCKKTFWGYKEMPYANRKEYSVTELSNDLLNKFKMSDANTLSSFFLSQSMNLLKVTKEYSEKKLMKVKMMQMKLKK